VYIYILIGKGNVLIIGKTKDRCLEAPNKRLYTPHIQAVKQMEQLKRGGAKISTLSEKEGLDSYVF